MNGRSFGGQQITAELHDYDSFRDDEHEQTGMSLAEIAAGYKKQQQEQLDKTERQANKEAGRGEHTDAEVQQRAVNKEAGRGEYTEAELQQCAVNKEAGRGEYTDAEMEQRAEDEARFTDSRQAASPYVQCQDCQEHGKEGGTDDDGDFYCNDCWEAG